MLAEPHTLRLPPAEAQVWVVDLDVPPDVCDRLRPQLSEDELARADRFIFPRDRRRYTVAHAALRAVLGRYLGRAATEVTLAAGENGKPRLVAAEDQWLRFNLSHSKDVAMIACIGDIEIGIDLEFKDPAMELAPVAAEFFAPDEQSAWSCLPPSARRDRFFDLWVCKEAYVKGLGKGLVHPSKNYSIRFIPGENPTLWRDHLLPLARSTWTIHQLESPPGYSAALAVAGGIRSISTNHYRFPHEN